MCVSVKNCKSILRSILLFRSIFQCCFVFKIYKGSESSACFLPLSPSLPLIFFLFFGRACLEFHCAWQAGRQAVAHCPTPRTRTRTRTRTQSQVQLQLQLRCRAQATFGWVSSSFFGGPLCKKFFRVLLLPFSLRHMCFSDWGGDCVFKN